jgi:hypothetical protein
MALRLISNIPWISMCLAIAGCSAGKNEAYVPNENVAKEALEAALSAWQGGKPMGRIATQAEVAVQPQDSDWQKGKKLVGFNIKNEITTSEGPKQFAVQLSLKGAKPIDVIYYVVGRDPLWVFRDADYKRSSGM